jgi:ATP-binding cassette subfamily F protein 3
LLDEPTNHLDLEMRHALSEALQEFEGALVVVSHDRHLLRLTTDTLLLVDGGEVTPFEGELDEYPAWIAARQVAKTPAAAVGPGEDAVSRKEKRRLDAEQRRQLQPLTKRLKALESRLAELTTRREKLERALAAPSLYEAAGKAQLLELLAQKRRIDADLEATESAWLETGEDLERLESVG